jgi:two-component system, LuxR family, sensor kinase FixL
MEINDNRPGKSREFIILREAVENANEAFVTIGENHKVIFFNKAAERMFGYCREEVLNYDLDIIMTPQCSKDHRKAVARYVQERKPTLIGHESEFTAVRKNGEPFSASISFSVAEIEGNLFFTALVRDVTETKALQERLIQSGRLAAIGQLVAEITHEIKNPLVLIGGFAKQLARITREEKENHKLNIIVQEVERLENLLLELRELYKPKSLVMEQFDINELLDEAHFFAKAAAEGKRVVLTLTKALTIPSVKGDRGKVKQVLLNLLKNALEALDQAGGGTLKVESAISGVDSVAITIADDGPGISQANQEKLFTPFFTTKKRGSGLGLCVCKRIIEDHENWSLSLESEEGKGTVVTITLPVTHAQ